MSSPSIVHRIGADDHTYIARYDESFPIIGLDSGHTLISVAGEDGERVVEKAREVADHFAKWADAVAAEQARRAQADAEATYKANVAAAAIADHQAEGLRLVREAVSS